MYFATHKLPTENLPKLHKQVKQLNNKAAKARVTSGSLKITVLHEVIQCVGRDEKGREVFRSFTWVTFLSNADFVLEGYKFVARYDFERDVEGNPVCHLHAMPGADVPAEFKETDGHCDHCNARRYRKNTFLVLNTETGEYKLFGRQCLKDIFTVSVAQIANLFEFVRNPGSIAGYDEDMPHGVRLPHYDPNDKVLGWAVSVFNKKGFVSKRVADEQDRQSTAELVRWLMQDQTRMSNQERQAHQEARKEFFPTEADRADVELLKGLIADAEADNDYIEKLQKVNAQGHCSSANFNLFVSAVTLLKKHRVTEERAEAVKNVPDVVEGRQEITGEIVSFRAEPGYGYYDPDVIKVLIRDDEGRKYWGTYPAALGTPTEGDRVTLTATVSQGRDDSKFGIFKRPAKASVVSSVNERAAA